MNNQKKNKSNSDTKSVGIFLGSFLNFQFFVLVCDFVVD